MISYARMRERFDWPFRKLDSFIRGESDFERARAIIPFIYYALFYIFFARLEGLNNTIAQGAAGFVPRLPLFWTGDIAYSTVVSIIFAGGALAVLCAAFFPQARLARILAFVAMLEFHAYTSSFGGPNHQWDLWLWVCFLLIFLPNTNKNTSNESRRIFSLVFWTMQAFVLLTYTMAGIGKLSYALIQIAHGQANAFSPDAGALYASTLLLQMNETVPFSHLLISHPLLAWLPFLLLLELQTFALAAAFKPELHRIWGVLLVLFHVATYLTMRAVFVGPSLLLLILLVSSPFAPPHTTLRQILVSVPLFGRLFRKRAASI